MNAPTSSLNLKVGTRYVRADGEITKPLIAALSTSHPFHDPNSSRLYTPEGKIFQDCRVCPHDLVKEYVPATEVHAALIELLDIAESTTGYEPQLARARQIVRNNVA